MCDRPLEALLREDPEVEAFGGQGNGRSGDALQNQDHAHCAERVQGQDERPVHLPTQNRRHLRVRGDAQERPPLGSARRRLDCASTNHRSKPTTFL